MSKLTVGSRVVVTFPDVDPPTEVGTIIEGPVFRQGRAAFKVALSDHDNWVPVDWVRPAVRAVE